MSFRNEDKMNEKPSRWEIGQFLLKEDGFEEIGSHDQHRIITDILGRINQVDTMWKTWQEFTQNYVIWVKQWISPLSTDPTSMWEQWGGMLRDLFLGV
jgi:hypothetical protein